MMCLKSGIRFVLLPIFDGSILISCMLAFEKLNAAKSDNNKTSSPFVWMIVPVSVLPAFIVSVSPNVVTLRRHNAKQTEKDVAIFILIKGFLSDSLSGIYPC